MFFAKIPRQNIEKFMKECELFIEKYLVERTPEELQIFLKENESKFGDDY